MADDLYIVYIAINLTIIPFFLLLKQKSISYRSSFLFIAGLLIGISHYIRSFSGIGVATFIIIMLLFDQKLNTIKKSTIIGFFAAEIIRSSLYFNNILTTYRTYGRQYISSFNECPAHPFWHSVYLGFGFLNFYNTDHIEWNDTCGEKKAQSRIPTITLNQSQEYEQILKEETLKLIIHQPFFVLLTLFSKIGVLLLYLLMFAGIGIFAFFVRSKDYLLDSAFIASLATSSLVSLVTIPCLRYASCFIAIAVIYSIISTNMALSEVSWTNKFKLRTLKPKFLA